MLVVRSESSPCDETFQLFDVYVRTYKLLPAIYTNHHNTRQDERYTTGHDGIGRSQHQSASGVAWRLLGGHGFFMRTVKTQRDRQKADQRSQQPYHGDGDYGNASGYPAAVPGGIQLLNNTVHTKLHMISVFKRFFKL